jgi:hypothetical protein
MGIQPDTRFPARSADALPATMYGHFSQAIYRNRPIACLYSTAEDGGVPTPGLRATHHSRQPLLQGRGTAHCLLTVYLRSCIHLIHLIHLSQPIHPIRLIHIILIMSTRPVTLDMWYNAGSYCLLMV